MYVLDDYSRGGGGGESKSKYPRKFYGFEPLYSKLFRMNLWRIKT